MEKYKLQDLPDDQIKNINITPENIKIANEWNTNSYIHPIIVPTNDIDDLKMQYNAWQSMSFTRQRISDSKAIEIFGVTNTDIYNYIMADLLKRYKGNDTSNNVEVQSVSVNNDSVSQESMALMKFSEYRDSILDEGFNSPKYAIYESFLEKIEKDYENKNPDLSFQAFIELKKLHESTNKIGDSMYPVLNIENAPYDGSINENAHMNISCIDEYGECQKTISINEWNDMYYAYLHGYLADDFKSSLSSRKNYIKEINESLVHLNNKIINESADANTDDMISYLKKSIDEVSGGEGSFTKEYFNNISKVNIVDVSNMSCKYITESFENTKMRPIFLIQSYGAKWYSKIIRDFSKGPYSHIAISIDPKLKKIYSFYDKGFEVESFDKYTQNASNSTASIYCMFVSNEDYDIIDDKIDYFLKNIRKTKYNWFGLLKIMMNRPGMSENKLVCSQFVDLMLKCIDIDLTNKDSSLVTPNDFKLSEKTAVYLLYDGPCKNLTDSAIKDILNKVNVLSGSVGCTYKDSIYYNSTINNILAAENDLSILRSYKKELLSLDNGGYNYSMNLKPYLETYIFDPRKLRNSIDLKYDGRHIKSIIKGEL